MKQWASCLEIWSCQSRPKTGLIDAFFIYLPYEDQGMAFFDWVETIYDPQDLAASFEARSWAIRLTDTILRRE